MEPRVEEKIDKIVDKITDIDVTLGKQSVILEEHVRRTNLLENKLEPIEKHVHMIQGALKFLGLISIFIAIIEFVLKMVGV
jgi:hypothetical protein